LRLTVNHETLEAHGLAKIYHGKRVVDGVDLVLKRNEIVGLLGPNGAGENDHLLHGDRSCATQ
jgi:ABC-type lipopolysaccharide export system ATPase subunit